MAVSSRWNNLSGRILTLTAAADSAEETGEDDDTMTITLVTTILVNPEEDRYSIDSPIGRAIHGKRIGDECVVQPEDGEPYTVRIVSVTPVDGEKFDIAGY